MTTEPDKQQNTNDQELASALAGISSDDTSAPAAQPASTGLAFEETPVGQAGAVSDSPFSTPLPPVPGTPAPAVPSTPAPATPSDSHLDGIKKDALNELRPLVDKLSVPAEEKFDTYLLLLRSTDDTTLIGPAHEAAREIPDEARRAQALLDIIKEIDYLSTEQK